MVHNISATSTDSAGNHSNDPAAWQSRSTPRNLASRPPRCSRAATAARWMEKRMSSRRFSPAPPNRGRRLNWWMSPCPPAPWCWAARSPTPPAIGRSRPARLATACTTLPARTTDGAGNVSANTSSIPVTIDTSLPAVSTPDLISDSGSSSTDNITNIVSPTVFTGTAEAGALVELFEGTTPLGVPTTASPAGIWTINVGGLSDGLHNVFARATDGAGNQANSGTLAITIDTTPPAPPSVPDLTAASDTGISNSDNLTKNTAPTFVGTSEANSKVTLIDVTGTPVTLGTATADGAGNWTITSSTLSGGTRTSSWHRRPMRRETRGPIRRLCR